MQDEATAQPDWQWFEEELSYDNAKLAQALIVSGQATGQKAVLERGLQAIGKGQLVLVHCVLEPVNRP